MDDSGGIKTLVIEKAVLSKTLLGLETPLRAQPLTIWIFWAAVHFQTTVEHAAHLKRFATLMLLHNCARFFHPRGQELNLTVFFLTVCPSYQTVLAWAESQQHPI